MGADWADFLCHSLKVSAGVAAVLDEIPVLKAVRVEEEKKIGEVGCTVGWMRGRRKLICTSVVTANKQSVRLRISTTKHVNPGP